MTLAVRVDAETVAGRPVGRQAPSTVLDLVVLRKQYPGAEPGGPQGYRRRRERLPVYSNGITGSSRLDGYSALWSTLWSTVLLEHT